MRKKGGKKRPFHNDIDRSRRSYANQLWANLGRLERDIASEMVIEIQVVTFAMHMYNFYQRPRYDKRRAHHELISTTSGDSAQVAAQLETLKFALVGANNQMRSISDARMGPMTTRFPHASSDNYRLAGRLPERLDPKLLDAIEEANRSNESARTNQHSNFTQAITAAFNNCVEVYDCSVHLADLQTRASELIQSRQPLSEEDNEALKRFVAAYLPIRTCYLIAAFAFLDLSHDRVKEFVIDLEDIIPEKDDEEDSPDAHMMQEPSSSVVVAFRIYSRISVLDAGLFEFLTNLRSAGTAIGIPLSEELILLDPIPAFRAAMCQYLRSDFQGALNWAEKCESVLEQRQVHLGDGESDVQDGPDVELVKVRQLEHSFLLFRFSDTSDFILDDLIDKIDRIDFRNGTEEWTPTRLRIVCGTFLVCCYLWSKVLENSRGSRHSPRLGTSIQKLASLLGDLTSSPQEGAVTRQFEKIYYRISVNWLDLFRDQDPTYDFDDLVGRIDTIDWHPREMKDFWLESVQIIEVSRGFCDLGWDEISEEVVAERQSAIFGARRRNPLDAMPLPPATGATVDRLQKSVQLGVGATTLIKNVLDLIARFSD